LDWGSQAKRDVLVMDLQVEAWYLRLYSCWMSRSKS